MCEETSSTANKCANKRPSPSWRINIVCITLYFITAVYASMTPCTGYELTTTTTTSTSPATTCASGANSNTIETLVGSDVNITCHIPDNQALTTLWFTVCYENGASDIIEVSNRNLKLLNSNTAVLMLNKLTEQRTSYTCRNGKEIISNTKLYVGTPPVNITDYLYMNNNTEQIICEFNKPYNGLPTNYTLHYTPDKVSYGLRPKWKRVNCNETPNRLKVLCRTNEKVDEDYSYYNLTLMATNKFGSNMQEYRIYILKNIVFAKLTSVNKITTGDSVLLSFTLWDSQPFRSSSAYKQENPYVIYEIGLKAFGFDWQYRYFNLTIEQQHLNITNLLGNYNYELSIRKRVAYAPTLWNEPYNDTFKTQAALPVNAPVTSVGGFYIDEINGEVQLFWQAVPQHKHNGSDFAYLVQQIDRGILKNISRTKYANITLSWNNHVRDYYIKSLNEVGISIAASHIRIYANSKKYNPSSVSVLTNNNSSTIYWKCPLEPGVSNYTVMWCAAKIASTNQCKDSPNFIYVDAQQTNFTINTLDVALKVAVAANYYNLSSGLHWSLCDEDETRDLVRVEPELYGKSSNHIELQWFTGRVCSILIAGYNVTYCELSSAVGPVLFCKNLSLSNEFQQEFVKFSITGLTPNTWYRINVIMYSKLKIGPISNYLYEKTQEAAPSAPRNLKIVPSSLTSNSVNITWEAPLNANGNIQKYTIWYGLRNHTKENFIVMDKHTLTARLDSFKSYTEYEVYVTASTVSESTMSNTIRFLTLIGVPSAPLDVNLDQSERELSWQPPHVPSGRVELYLVRLTIRRPNMQEEIVHTLDAVSAQRMRYTYNAPECTDPLMRYKLQVKAINVAAPYELDNTTFPDMSVNDVLKPKTYSYADSNHSANSLMQIKSNVKPLKCYGGEIMLLPNNVLAHVLATLPAFLRKHRGHLQFFCSPWETARPIINCSPPTWEQILLTGFPIVFLFVVISVSLWARQKYKSMRIGAKLPGGLCAQEAPEYSVEKKTNFEQNFNTRMLHPTQTESTAQLCMGLDNSGVYTYQLGSLNTYTTLLTNTNTSSPESTRNSSVNMNTRSMSSASVEHMAEKSLLSSSLSSIDEMNYTSAQLVKAKEYLASGYVNPEKLTSKSMEPSLDYAKISQLQQPVVNDYIKASSLDVTAEMPTAAEPIIDHSNKSTIWGYVTQKQLAEFSQENR